MVNYTEKKLNINKADDFDLEVVKDSLTSNEEEEEGGYGSNDDNNSNIGLDLLANVHKMNKSPDNSSNDNKHEEIDIISNDRVSEDNNEEEESSRKDSNEERKKESSSTYYDNDYKSTEHNKYKEEEEEPVKSLDDILEEKKKLLYEFERMKKRGIHLSKHFTLASNLDEMKHEFETIKKQREVENSVQFSRKMLMAFVTALEFLNNRFDPFDLKLDGWSETVHEGIGEYDDVFEELHEKYKSTGKVSPEIKLLLTLGGSAFMFHLTNNIFKSAMPQFESMVGNNPNIINNMMNKGAQGGGQPEAPRPQPSKGMGGMGGMGGLSGLAGLAGLGGLGGLGGGGDDGGGMGDLLGMMSNLSKNMGNPDVPKKTKMNGPQGVETLLDSLSAGTTTKAKKKGGNGLKL
tara:strand:+ start:411 stop:1622 length:1212 start_codon:yes stop_codon:yes gene_type:complete